MNSLSQKEKIEYYFKITGHNTKYQKYNYCYAEEENKEIIKISSIIILLVLIIFKNKKYGIFMSIDLILITILQYALKFTFTRNRPLDINLIEETGYSFPSGHSLTAMAFYGFIIYLIYTSKLHKRSKYIYITLFSILILIMGLSRIYLGVHFFTDVLGAFSLSLSFLIIYTHFIKERIR